MFLSFPSKSTLTTKYPLACFQEGAIHRTVLNNGNIIQFPPTFTRAAPAFFLRIVSRWLWPITCNVPTKADLLVERSRLLQQIIQAAPDSLSLLQTPLVHQNFDNSWIMEEVRFSKTLEVVSKQLQPTDLLQIFTELVRLLEHLHSAYFGDGSARVRKLIQLDTRNLQSYYFQRFGDLHKAFEWFSAERHDLCKDLKTLAKKSLLLQEAISACVYPFEHLTPTHGDLNPSTNLLVTPDCKIHIIDLDQGLLGGDPLVDIWKLRLFRSSARLQNLINQAQSSALVRYYFKNYLGAEDVLLHLGKRIELLRFDNLASALVFKLMVESPEGILPGDIPSLYRPASEVIPLLL